MKLSALAPGCCFTATNMQRVHTTGMLFLSLCFDLTSSSFNMPPSISFVPLRCVAILSTHLPLPFLPHWLCWSSSGVLSWPPVQGFVPGLGVVCCRCSGVPARGAGGGRVPGETGRSAGQTPSSLGLQVPPWPSQRGAVSTHILEGAPAARLVSTLMGWGSCAWKSVGAYPKLGFQLGFWTNGVLN